MRGVGIRKNKSIGASSSKVLQKSLKVKSSTSSFGVYGDLGRYTLFITRYVRNVKYWSRIVKSENILIVHLYQSLVDACNKGVNNRAKGCQITPWHV